MRPGQRFRAADLEHRRQDAHQRVGLADDASEQLLLLGRVVGLGRRMGGGAQPADRRAQIVREAVGKQPQFLHQRADPVEHRVDLAAEPVERVVRARYRHALATGRAR